MGSKALKTPKIIRGPKAGSRGTRKSLDLIAFQREVVRGFDRAAGKVREFKVPWHEGKVK